MSETSRAAIPKGFRPLEVASNFVAVNGPIFGRFEDGVVRLGLPIESRHCNPIGVCHGGMLATMADMQIIVGIIIQCQLPYILPTVSLNCDFAGPARAGQWLEGVTDVLKVTKRMAFASCLLTADGEPALRASAVVKISDIPNPAIDFEALFGSP